MPWLLLALVGAALLLLRRPATGPAGDRGDTGDGGTPIGGGGRPPIPPTADNPFGAVTPEATLDVLPSTPNGWTPRLSYAGGRLFLLCGAAEVWILELDRVTLIVLRTFTVGPARAGPGGWRSPSIAVWYLEGQTPEGPGFSRHEIDVSTWTDQAPPISREVAALASTVGGNTVNVRDGLVCEFTVGLANRVNGEPIDLQAIVNAAELAGLNARPTVFNWGPAVTAVGVWACTINDNSAIVRRNTTNGRTILRPVSPTGRAAFELAIGPGGSVMYGQGQIRGFAGVEPETDLSLAPWGEGVGYVFTGPGGGVWISTNTWNEAAGRGLVLIRPWGSSVAVILDRPTIFNTIVVTPAGFIVATADDRGRARVDRLALDSPFAPLADPARPPTPLELEGVRMIETYAAPVCSTPRHFGFFFDRNDGRGYPTTPAPGTTSVLVAHPSLGPPGPTTWGWEFYAAHGPVRRVIAATDGTAATVPDEFLLALYWGLEGGLAYWGTEARANLRAAQAQADGRGKPLLVYCDDSYSEDRAIAWARGELSLDNIPLQQCYAGREPGTPTDQYAWSGLVSGQANQARWRRGFAKLDDAGFARLAMVRTMYTQSRNFPPLYIVALQPYLDALANEFGVDFDLAFSWARPSGVLLPYPGGLDLRMLIPYAEQLTERSQLSGV